jgi:hypothetical protein
MKNAKTGQTGTESIRQLGNLGMLKQEQPSARTYKRPRTKGSNPTERVRPRKRPRDSSGPRTHKEALTNMNIVIFKENYPKDELTEDDQRLILEELERVLHGTLKVKLPHLRSFRLEGCALMYVYADQQSVQWLIKATDNHRWGSGGRLKVADTTNLPNPVKVALRMKNKVAKCFDVLRWIRDLDPEHCSVLEGLPELKRLILINRHSFQVIKKTTYRIVTRLTTSGPVKAMNDPEAGPRGEEGA